ncbi:hypothetical protein V2J09_020799 [Rumex salicifolius]
MNFRLKKNMAMQTGVSSSKVLILVGAGLTGSIILKSGRLSDVLLQLQDLISGVNENDLSPNKIDGAILAAQIRQLAQEIRELSRSNPITIFDGNSASTASYSSYLVPAATLGAMGYCYMWWKGWSFSDAMFVTKQNMANAVDAVSKQLEGVSEALASTKRHLLKHLENLDWKVEEQKGISKLIAHDVNDVKHNLSDIGNDIEFIHQMITGLEGKLNLLEDKQDMTNSGLQYLCHVAGGIKNGLNVKLFQNVESNPADHPKITYTENPIKGLQSIVEPNNTTIVQNPTVGAKKDDLDKLSGKNITATKTRLLRSYPLGISLACDLGGAKP